MNKNGFNLFVSLILGIGFLWVERTVLTRQVENCSLDNGVLLTHVMRRTSIRHIARPRRYWSMDAYFMLSGQSAALA